MEDYQDDQTLDETLLTTRNRVFDLTFIKSIYYHIAIDKEIARRVTIFQELEKLIDTEGRDVGNPLNRADIKKIEAQGARAFADTEVDQNRKPLTDEQIEGRQRFYKQCALMLNIHRLSPSFEDVISERMGGTQESSKQNKKKPFDEGF